MPHRSIRVAWLLGTDLRPYRIPFLNRLAQEPSIEVTVYAGGAKPGLGAPKRQVQTPDSRVPLKPLINHFWPHGKHRVAWQSGALSMLADNYDVLVVPEIVHNLTVWSLVALRRRFQKRLVLFGFGYRPAPTTLVARIKERARLFLISRADAIISYTERGHKACLAAGVSRSRLFVSQNTLDTDYLRSLSQKMPHEELEKTQERLNLAHHVLIHVGRLVPEKLTGVLIDAIKTLHQRGLDCSLIIIGDGPERASLEAQADDLTNVHFLGAIYDEKLVARYFMLSDMLVIPGRIGLTCVHGFSYGVPTITTSDRAVSQSPEYDYLLDGVNSVIVDDPDPRTYAESIERLLDEPDHLEALRAGAVDTAKRLSMSAMVDGFVAATIYAAGLSKNEAS